MPVHITISESETLNDALTRAFPTEKALLSFTFNGVERNEFHGGSYLTNIRVDSQGVATFEDECTQNRYLDFEARQLRIRYFDPAQRAAMEQAFTYTLEGMERVMGKDLKGTAHRIIAGIQEVKPAANQVWSGPWHRDDAQDGAYPITTIVYFNHENISSRLSFREYQARNWDVSREWESASSDDPAVYSLETYSGCTVTFNNQKLQHCVNTVHRLDQEKPAHRFLLTFFYEGPQSIPASVTPVNFTDSVIYFFAKSRKASSRLAHHDAANSSQNRESCCIQ
jgi:hypothetical protein